MMLSNTDLEPLIRKLFSDDPLDCMAAIEPLALCGPHVLRAIASSNCGSAHLTNFFLRQLTMKIGASAGPALLNLVAGTQLSNQQKICLSACFAGLPYDSSIASALADICNPQENDIELCRVGYSCLGYFGAHHWSFLLSDYCFFGRDSRAQFARTGQLDSYVFGKLWPYYLDALICSLCRPDLDDPEDATSAIAAIEDLIKRLDEHHPTAFNYSSFYFNKRIGDYAPAVVDPVMRRWINHEDGRIRSAAVAIISQILPARATAQIFKLAKSGRDDLGVIAGDLFSQRSCEALQQGFAFDANSPFFRWSFSLLFGFPVDWGDWDARATELLDHLDEPGLMLLYSMAAKGDVRSAEHIDSMLDAMDTDPHTSSSPHFTRGVGALCLAMTDPTAAKIRLPDLYGSATDKIEMLFIAAALCIAGHASGGKWVHSSLVRARDAFLLRPVWKRVLVSALIRAKGIDPDAVKFWASYLGVDANKALHHLNLTKIGKFRRLLSKKSKAIDGRPMIFISYAHEDRHWLEQLTHIIHHYLPSTAIFWEDSSIRMGPWLERITAAMDAASVFSFLVTPNMIRSTFIMSTELPAAIEKARQSAADISWILLEDCDVLKTALSDWQGFSDQSKSVSATSALSNIEESAQSRILDEYAMYILDAAQRRLEAS